MKFIARPVQRHDDQRHDDLTPRNGFLLAQGAQRQRTQQGELDHMRHAMSHTIRRFAADAGQRSDGRPSEYNAHPHQDRQPPLDKFSHAFTP
jgi:hypothetical protein